MMSMYIARTSTLNNASELTYTAETNCSFSNKDLCYVSCKSLILHNHRRRNGFKIGGGCYITSTWPQYISYCTYSRYVAIFEFLGDNT